jgi:hypothetical protein
MPVITLPTLHPDQLKAFEMTLHHRFVAVRCGRRWGKTDLGITMAVDYALKGRNVGWFAPDYKFSSEAFNRVIGILGGAVDKSSRIGGVVRIKPTWQSGRTERGRIDFWTLNNPDAGRSRFYDLAIIDEGAFTDKKIMMDTWLRSIKPTLLDRGGRALVLSNTKGLDPENFFCSICPSTWGKNEQPAERQFVEFHAPSINNPHVPRRIQGEDDATHYARREAVFEEIKASNHPLVYQQEYLAEFVDWSGVAFFALTNLLYDGHPIPLPAHCDYIYATIDTATKTGQENDGTAVIYWAKTLFGLNHPLIILDYHIMQIEGSLLETWLPTVFETLESLVKQTGARRGSVGAFIEDKSSGMVLLQQAKNRGWPATPIDSKLTAMGKSERAINVSGHVYRNSVKISVPAYDRVVPYKGHVRNHMVNQVVGFRVGDTEDAEDDLLDCFTYGITIGLGNPEGF